MLCADILGYVQLTDVLHALSEHHLVEDLTTIHAHKAVIHLGLAEWLQGLYVLVTRLLTIERRTGHRPLRRCGRRSLC